MKYTHPLGRLSRIRAPGKDPFLGLLVLLVGLWGCSSTGPRTAAAPEGDWLDHTGFSARDSWPSALLHMDRDELRSANSISAVFGGLENVSVQSPGPGSFGIELFRPGGEGPCLVNVYMNGNPTSPHPVGGSARLDDVFGVRMLEGLELHAGLEGPILEEGECGSLLLWSEGLQTPGDRSFHGTIEGTVQSTGVDPVIRVELEPTGVEQLLGSDGSFAFVDLLPGEYEVAFHTRAEVIARANLRVFAFRASRFDLEIGDEELDAH